MRLIDADALLEVLNSKEIINLRHVIDLISNASTVQQSEPFGYFKAEPFGWTDCAETDEGAIALYEATTVQREGWVSVKDAMPDYSCTQKRVRVLVYWKDTKAVFTLWYGVRFGLKEPEFYEENEWTESNDGEIDENDNLYLGDCLSFKNITHWQPLPAAPTDKE